MPQVVCLYRLHVWQMDNYLVPAIFELIRAHDLDFIRGIVRLRRLGSFFSNFLINFALGGFFICIKDFFNKAKCSAFHLIRLALILECKTFSFVFFRNFWSFDLLAVRCREDRSPLEHSSSVSSSSRLLLSFLDLLAVRCREDCPPLEHSSSVSSSSSEFTTCQKTYKIHTACHVNDQH